jgi:5'-AMP-activated protein kinase regulatory gamma subunit
VLTASALSHWIPIDSHPHRYNNLDVSVSAALTARHGRRFDEVQTCLLSDALGDILDRMVNKDLHRLIIVDQHKRLLGVISLSDILTLFIM